MRLDAMLNQFGFCSRREAATWIKAGRVRHAGQALRSPTLKAKPEELLVDGKPIPFVNGLYVALHKPVGYTCSHREQGLLVDDLLPAQWHRRKSGVQTVGRLDKETSGLLLLTDDGTFLHSMTSPRRHVSKRYRFTCSAAVPAKAVDLFASGEFILEGESAPCRPATLVLDSECGGCLTLHEGRYHQVRRMLAAVDAPVELLHREAIGKMELSDLNLKPGEWCAIDPAFFGL